MVEIEGCTEPPGDLVRFMIDGSPVLDYVLRSAGPTLESPRPYCAPIRTRAGEIVTGVRPADHVWHRGLSWSLPVVGEDNFWGGPSYLPGRGYVQMANNGTQQHVGYDRIDPQGAAGASRGTGIEHRVRWLSQDGLPLFGESRRITVAEVDDRAWLLTFTTSMTNVCAEPIALGSPATRGHANVGYGGLFWRGPSSFRGGRILVPPTAVTGSARTEPFDIRAAWLGFAGDHPNGRSSTIVMVDAPENETHPTAWFVRSEEYAGMCPAPFLDAERLVAPGAAYRARYAVVVSDGDHDAFSAEPLAAAGRAALNALDSSVATASGLPHETDIA